MSIVYNENCVGMSFDFITAYELDSDGKRTGSKKILHFSCGNDFQTNELLENMKDDLKERGVTDIELGIETMYLCNRTKDFYKLFPDTEIPSCYNEIGTDGYPDPGNLYGEI